MKNLYVVDSIFLQSAIVKYLGLELKDGMYQAKTAIGNNKLIQIEPEFFINGKMRRSKECQMVKEAAESSSVSLNIAFTPGITGWYRYSILMKEMDIDEKNVHFLNMDTIEMIEENVAYNKISDKELKQYVLKKWAEASINDAITREFKKRNIDLNYFDCTTFPFIKAIGDREARISDPSKAEYVLDAEISIINHKLIGRACDKHGRVRRRLEKSDFHTSDELGKITHISKKKRIVHPPLFYDYHELTSELVKEGFYAADVDSKLLSLYEEGYITYPRTISKTISKEMQPKIAEADELFFAGHEEFINEFRFFDMQQNGIREDAKENGIVLLYADNLDDVFESSDNITKRVLEKLIVRQLCQYAEPCELEEWKVILQQGENYFCFKWENIITSGWKVLDDGFGEKEAIILEEGEVLKIDNQSIVLDLPRLYTSESLLRLMKINAVGTQNEISECFERLNSSDLISVTAGNYAIRKRDAENLRQLPNRLMDINLGRRLYRLVKSVSDEELTEREFKKQVVQEIKTMIAALDAMPKGENKDEN